MIAPLTVVPSGVNYLDEVVVNSNFHKLHR